MYRKILLPVCCVLWFCVFSEAAFPQPFGITNAKGVAKCEQLIVEQTKSDQSRITFSEKFDSFGVINCEDAMSRLDGFAVRLQNAPEMQAYIIVRPKKDELMGKAITYLRYTKDYLVNSRGINPSRINTIVGDFNQNITTELWIAPENFRPLVELSKKAVVSDLLPYKYDDNVAFVIIHGEKPKLFFGESCGLEELDLNGYAERLRLQPNSNSYIIIYRGFDEQTNNTPTVARLLKDTIVKEHKISARRIKTAYGGQREMPTAELWILPKGASTPKPSPDKKR